MHIIWFLWPLTMLLNSCFAAKIVTDRLSDRSKGFGFVTLASQDEAENAIEDMKGKVIIKSNLGLTCSLLS